MPGRTVRTNRTGFTVIELLIVVAIIGILATMLVPMFLDALHRAKQKRTMTEMNQIGTATMSWITDNVAAGAAGAAGQIDVGSWGPVTTPSALSNKLVPMYVQRLTEVDGWRNAFEFRLNSDLSADRLFIVRSPAWDKVFDSDTYTAGAFDPTDYAQDIVWADGFFVRWPDRLQ